MQLVAYGAQDIYLTGNPQITFFKVVYRRHTNFAMECIEQTMSGTAAFGSEVSVTISRNGDLVNRMYLEHAMTFESTTAATTDNTLLCERYGDSLIKECEIEIGGQKIDKHISMWNRVWSDLTEFNPTGLLGYGPALTTTPITAVNGASGTLQQLMTGNGLGLSNGGTGTASAFGVADGGVVNGFTYTNGTTVDVGTIFLPLQFWFCRNPGLALPLIALQYHEVKVKMTFETKANLARSMHQTTNGTVIAFAEVAAPVSPNFNLWCDYIYLDTDERRRFAQVSHEYLIEQLQYSENTVTSASTSIALNFNHPVKELIWCTRNEGTASTSRCGASGESGVLNDPSAGPASLDGMGGNWQLKLNGHDRFKVRDTKYFTRTQVWQHHTGYGALATRGSAAADSDLTTETAAVLVGSDSIAVYSFALKPEEHQPSGTCNFSRIDNAQLVGTSLLIAREGENVAADTPAATDAMKLTIFAVNYNVLRIMSGMGGLAYSN